MPLLPRIFACGLLLLLGTAAAAQPHAVADETLLGLGRIAADGGPVQLSWTVTNKGTEALVLGEGESTHPALVGRWPHTPIQPGQRVRIEATFDPKDYNARNALEQLQIRHNGRAGVLLLSFFGRWARPGEQVSVGEMPPSSNTGSLWGYIDRQGQQVIAPTYQWASEFREGRAVVEMDGLWGHIDRSGRVTTPCKYVVDRGFSEGVAWVLTPDKKWGTVDIDGQYVITPQFDGLNGDYFHNGMAAVMKNNRWFFIDQRGRDLGLVHDPLITELSLPVEGYSWFGYGAYGKGGKWGFMDAKGKVIVPPMYDYAFGDFNDGLAMVTVGDQRGYINTRNEFIIPPQYDEASAFEGGRTVVSKKGGPYQAIDTKGRVLFTFPAGTEGAATDYDGRYCYLVAGQRGYLDEQGRVVVPPTYRYYNNYHQGRATGSGGGYQGFIDRSGQVVIGFEYEEVNEYGQYGLAPVKGSRNLTARQTRPDTPDERLVEPGNKPFVSMYRPGLQPAGPLPLAYLPPKYESLGEPLQPVAPGTIRASAPAIALTAPPAPVRAADTTILHSLRLPPVAATPAPSTIKPNASAPVVAPALVGTADTTIFHSLRLSVAATPAPAAAATWRGRVLDAQTKEMLPLALVRFTAAPAAARVLPLVAATGAFSQALPVDQEFSYEAVLAGYVPANATRTLAAAGLTEDILLEPLKVGATVKLDNIRFLQGKYDLLPPSFAALDKLVQLMQQYPRMTIELRGHTDNQGDDKDRRPNQRLSEDRVAEVKKYLTGKGVAAPRISGQGFGGSQPIADNRREMTRKLNRRVEFRITRLE